MTAETETCAKCGKALTRQQIWRRSPYCSRECYADARWGEKVCFGGIETRRPQVIAAAKLCQLGMTQAAVARELGVHPCQVWEWIEQYGAENFAPVRVCEHCGKSLAGMRYLSNRKYCSRSCSRKLWHARNYSPSLSGRQKLKFDPALRAQALESYWDGLGPTEIAQQLGVVKGTVDSWVHDFGDLRERRKPTKQQLQEAQTADEWLQALREAASAPESESVPVRLVCGEILGSGGMNRLVTIISEVLRQNPFSGETFAFCTKERRTIVTITWKPPAFRIVTLPKMYGCYAWPRAEFGPVVDVAPGEFEYLLSFCKRPCEAQKNLDLSRFS